MKHQIAKFETRAQATRGLPQRWIRWRQSKDQRAARLAVAEVLRPYFKVLNK